MSFLAKLKTETTECHVALEKSLDILRRVQTEEDYRTLIARFFTIYEPLEKCLFSATDWSAVGWNFSTRLKTPWLAEDLRALGMPDPEVDALPRCQLPIPCDTLGAVIGCLYVIEGSTLGGQMLSRQFRDMLTITPERGGRFFQGYGEATMPQWRAFGGWAEGQAQSAGGTMEEPAIRGARSTFDAFSKWLT